MYREKNEKEINNGIRTYCLINMLRSMNNSIIGIWYIYAEIKDGSVINISQNNTVSWEFKSDGTLIIADNDCQSYGAKYTVNDGELTVMGDNSSTAYTIEHMDKNELILQKQGAPQEKVYLRKNV